MAVKKKRSRRGRKEVHPWESANMDCCEPQHYITIGRTLLTSPHFKALKPTARLVYLALDDWACGASFAKISYRAMQQQYGIPMRSFVAAVQELREAGFLKERREEAVEQYAAATYDFSVEWKTRPPPEKVKQNRRGNS